MESLNLVVPLDTDNKTLEGRCKANGLIVDKIEQTQADDKFKEIRIGFVEGGAEYYKEHTLDDRSQILKRIVEEAYGNPLEELLLTENPPVTSTARNVVGYRLLHSDAIPQDSLNPFQAFTSTAVDLSEYDQPLKPVRERMRAYKTSDELIRE